MTDSLASLTENSLRGQIAAQCRRNADAIALLAPGRRALNYGQLAAQIDYVGGTIRTLGIQRSGRVAVVLPNGPDMAAAFLGIAAFATCAPLNPRLGQAEFEFYLKDLQAQAVIVPAGIESPARDVAQRLNLAVMELTSSPGLEAGHFRFETSLVERAEASDRAQPTDVALMLHTSGTTSRPKLVPLSHRNLCASAHNVRSVLELTSRDRCLNVMPLFHIHGLVGALLSSIAGGAAVVCCPGYEETAFTDWMSEFEPTWYTAVPTIHQSILTLVRPQGGMAGSHCLRFIRSSSASLPPSVSDALERAFRVPVIETYGMTEAAHQMASNQLPPALRRRGSVGLPAGPEMAILDDNGRLLGPGEKGEIAIRGLSVMDGYENNPEANASGFVNGWFRTGDLGRTDADGYFYIIGRTKEMINRGGENISPQEIDDVLVEHEAVVEAVTFSVPHDRLGEDVAAAAVLRDDTTLSENELRAFALSRLAEFKIPSQIVFLSEIPKGPTGKPQRIGLHEKLSALLRPAFVAPRSTTEQALTGIWQEVLAEDRIGVNDNFFRLGGDSLLATRVISRARQALTVEIPLRALFEAPTIEGLAKFVDTMQRAATPVEGRPLSSTDDIEEATF